MFVSGTTYPELSSVQNLKISIHNFPNLTFNIENALKDLLVVSSNKPFDVTFTYATDDDS